MSLTKTKAIAERIERHRPGHYGAGRREMRRSALAMFNTALVTPPRMSGSEWAEKHGRIPKAPGADSGPVTLYGYQRGLLNVMCDPTVPRVTVLKAARVGYTRCATLAVGYHLHHDPSLCAIAQPVKEDAEDFGGTEIAPMLRETPVLRRMIRPARRGVKPDKSTYFKLSNGASVRLVGAAADDAFRRYSAKFLFADEIDADGWTPDFKSQGDKLSLFWTRGEKFWDRRLVVGSTPLLEETSRIAKLWAKSDQRRYFVPCRQCSEDAGELAGWQYLDWGGKDTLHGVKWDFEDDGSLKTVWYAGTCGCIVQEADKAWMDDHGEWRATNTSGDHPGFHLWTGMSLDVNAAWRVIVKEWLDAQADPATLVQPFVNLRLGRTYRASYGQEIKASKFLERAEDYGAEVPAWVKFLSLGGDVQSGQNARIEASVYGWGLGLEAALIGHFVLPGDPAEPGVWQALDLLLKREFTKADGTVLRVRAAAIDSGGHHTAETYAFCNERHARRVWAIKGRSETQGRRGNIWPRTPTGKLGSVSFGIGGNAARDWAYGSLAIDKLGTRFVHFPHEGAKGSRPIDVEFFEQLTREKLIVVKGHMEWEKRGVREVGVCWVYAYVAVTGLQAMSGKAVALGKAAAEIPPDSAETTEGAPIVAEAVPLAPQVMPAPALPTGPQVIRQEAPKRRSIASKLAR